MKWLLGTLAVVLIAGAVTYTGVTVGQKLDALAVVAGSYNEPVLSEADVISIVRGYLWSKFESADKPQWERLLEAATAKWTATHLGNKVWKVVQVEPPGGASLEARNGWFLWGKFIFDEQTFELKRVTRWGE